MSLPPLPWTFDHDPVQQATYGNDWPLTANVRGISLDGDGDYKPCFARVKFGGSVSMEDQRKSMETIVRAVNAHDTLLAALIAARNLLARFSVREFAEAGLEMGFSAAAADLDAITRIRAAISQAEGPHGS